MHRLEACARAVDLAGQLDAALSRLSRHPLVVGMRGVSCFRALELADADGPLGPDAIRLVVARVREAGALIQPGIGCALLVPSLVYTRAEVQELEANLATGLDRAADDLLT
jgi:adenosylmethionine-8-amino-7-oxononanoate aminotransferase